MVPATTHLKNAEGKPLSRCGHCGQLKESAPDRYIFLSAFHTRRLDGPLSFSVQVSIAERQQLGQAIDNHVIRRISRPITFVERRKTLGWRDETCNQRPGKRDGEIRNRFSAGNARMKRFT